ncbi:protein CNPPD1-like [Anneissia japonica]|uniref:protein CNPPD1-like n=1 Tax=Anneissia japonica TaxID=1529436 RepID=UPI001425B061|nr:protein CNPPD1-like [Anneissia japonica]
MADFEDFMRVSEECLEDIEQFERSPFNLVLTERLRKTLYFGKDTPASGHAHPLTDLASQLFQNSNQSGIRPVDTRYVSNVARKSSISPCTLMVALIYLERLRHKNPNYLKNVASADLFLVTMMIATKFSYDEGEDEEMFNDEWAKAGNLDTESVHKLEKEFLCAIDWDLFVKPPDFLKCLNQVEQTIALKEGSRRGWFSYTDLSILLNNPNYLQAMLTMLDHMMKIMCACILTYSFLATSAIFSVVAFHQAQAPTLDSSTHHLMFGSLANRATQANAPLDSVYTEIILKMTGEPITDNVSSEHGLEDHVYGRKIGEEPITNHVSSGYYDTAKVAKGRPITRCISSQLGFKNRSRTNENHDGLKPNLECEHVNRLRKSKPVMVWRDPVLLMSQNLYIALTTGLHHLHDSIGVFASG